MIIKETKVTCGNTLLAIVLIRVVGFADCCGGGGNNSSSNGNNNGIDTTLQILFESNWDTALRNNGNTINDGGKWDTGYCSGDLLTVVVDGPMLNVAGGYSYRKHNTAEQVAWKTGLPGRRWGFLFTGVFPKRRPKQQWDLRSHFGAQLHRQWSAHAQAAHETPGRHVQYAQYLGNLWLHSALRGAKPG